MATGSTPCYWKIRLKEEVKGSSVQAALREHETLPTCWALIPMMLGLSGETRLRQPVFYSKRISFLKFPFFLSFFILLLKPGHDEVGKDRNNDNESGCNHVESHLPSPWLFTKESKAHICGLLKG